MEFSNKKALPLLLLLDRFGQSPLDRAIEKNSIKSIDLFIEMMQTFQSSYLLNHLIDKNLIELIEKGLNLKEYFESNMPIYQIQELNYPNLHHNNKKNIYINDALQPSDILSKESYNKIIAKDVDIEEDPNQNGNKNSGTNKQQFPIDYYLINIPQTTSNPKLIQVLQQSNRMELFESLCIQTIIDYKWQTYTFKFFRNQFLVFIAFIAIFLIEFYYSLSDIQEFQSYQYYWYFSISLKVMGNFIILYFLKHEITSLIMEQSRNYLSYLWNLYDFSLILAYFSYSVIDYYEYSLKGRTILLCLILILIFLKINQFLRIYENFSFLVSLLFGVFFDLRYFIIFFFLTIMLFGMLFSILVANSDVYDSIGVVGYFIMAYRASLGDFEVDQYGSDNNIDNSEQIEIIILRWAVWICCVFIMNIIFMNFIIASISESYEKSMQRLKAQSYKVKVDLIAEREVHFSSEDLVNPIYFPKYLILRKPVEGQANDNNEWQGFVKDIKDNFEKNLTKQNIILKSQISKIQTEMQQNQENQKNGFEKIEKKFLDEIQQLKSLLESSNEKKSSRKKKKHI